MRPPSGTRYWQRNKTGDFEARAALQFKLHQNPYEEPKPSIPPPPPDEIKMMRPGGGYEVLTMAEVAARDTAARGKPGVGGNGGRWKRSTRAARGPHDDRPAEARSANHWAELAVALSGPAATAAVDIPAGGVNTNLPAHWPPWHVYPLLW